MFKIKVIIGLLLAVSPALFAETTLCKKNEYAYFSCELTNNKIISFCSPSKIRKTLSYRYGLPNKIEVNYNNLISKYGIGKYEKGVITKEDQGLISQGKIIPRTGKEVILTFASNDNVIYQFNIYEFLVLSGEKASEVLSKDFVHTKIDDRTYIESLLTAEHRIHGSRYFEGQCKQGIGFQNLFQLKNNKPKELELFLRKF